MPGASVTGWSTLCTTECVPQEWLTVGKVATKKKGKKEKDNSPLHLPYWRNKICNNSGYSGLLITKCLQCTASISTLRPLFHEPEISEILTKEVEQVRQRRRRKNHVRHFTLFHEHRGEECSCAGCPWWVLTNPRGDTVQTHRPGPLANLFLMCINWINTMVFVYLIIHSGLMWMFCTIVGSNDFTLKMKHIQNFLFIAHKAHRHSF